jgi:hypothetical protein
VNALTCCQAACVQADASSRVQVREKLVWCGGGVGGNEWVAAFCGQWYRSCFHCRIAGGSVARVV